MTRFMYPPETEALLRRRLRVDEDIGDILDAMEAVRPALAPSTTAKATAALLRLELRLAWIDSAIPVSFHVYVNDENHPVTCEGVRGGLLFLRIPNSLLRPGKNRLRFHIFFWTGGWKYQLDAKTATRRKRMGGGKDSNPNEPQVDTVSGSEEIEL